MIRPPANKIQLILLLALHHFTAQFLQSFSKKGWGWQKQVSGTMMLKRPSGNSCTWFLGSAGAEGEASHLSQAEDWALSKLPPAPISLKQDKMGWPHQATSLRSRVAAETHQ